MTDKRPTITYQMQGGYSYEYKDAEYDRYIADRHIDEFIEHALQIVTPYTHVRIIIEICE